MKQSIDITASLQDYLEVILGLAQDEKQARVTDIAEVMSIAKPSVIQALNLLKEKKLIEQERYGPVKLTEKGWEYAQKVRHRHNVIYGFLTQVLSVSPEAAEKDACLMEHDLSQETFQRLLVFLNNQEVDTILQKEINWRYEHKNSS